ncbi:hypothetical protein KVG88_30280 [Pseudomonas sp. SWRI74]|uniref:Uncharacterized protein n=1 Tax=Pseudomonas azerbaijanoccidentalis TaxID=2842347 RepID=A0ABS6QZQ3_9PSED|nr:hypothetical protein [Pseudomonas azerbaijanoccidentalis]MBV4524364.1 hypothetical protein [Pseudomonas azerbaijanoccidentalis]
MSNTAKAKGQGQAHDIDLLLASNVGAFEQWLRAQGITVTPPDKANIARGVHYWVELQGCKPVSVQEGSGRNARYAQTHFRLRPLLSRFLASPVASAIKDIVRPTAPGQLQIVVSGQLQAPSRAVNGEVPALLQANRAGHLLSDADIDRALAIESPIPEAAEVKHVFGVRVAGAGRKGMTVVAHMKVYDAPDSRRLVEVIDYPICSEPGALQSHAEALFKRAEALPNATILVDVLDDGLELFQNLQAIASLSVARYGLTMGMMLPKSGSRKRFTNLRTECTVRAAEAIKGGEMKLMLPIDPVVGDPFVLFGSKTPYHMTPDARFQVAKPSEIEASNLPTADLLEAICLAFHGNELPTVAEQPSEVEPAPAPAPAAPAPAKPLDQYLSDLRDDFAATCPLVWDREESMAAFANRRWVYAQAMIDARPQ